MKVFKICFNQCNRVDYNFKLNVSYHILMKFFQIKCVVCEIVQCIYQVKHVMLLFY